METETNRRVATRPPRKETTIAAYVSEELYEQVRRRAFDERTSLSGVVRRALIEYLKTDVEEAA